MNSILGEYIDSFLNKGISIKEINSISSYRYGILERVTFKKN